MTTIKDIARISGFSIGTVSRVINHSSDVSPATREKIEAVIREQNFQPNRNARSLKQIHHSPVMIFVKGTHNIFLDAILEEIQIQMHIHGENTNVTFLGETDNAVAEAVQISMYQRPKGCIFLGGSVLNFQKDFSRIDVPSVLVTADASCLGFDGLSSYTTDDYSAAYEAVSYLIRQGHREIGIIGGNPDSAHEGNVEKRIAGAAEAMRQNRIDFAEKERFEPCGFLMDDGYAAVLRLMERCPEITAVFAISDLIAIGAMRALQDKGYRVPEDISLIGFDGIPFAVYTNPRLATIHQNVPQLAKKAVEDLLLRIKYQRAAAHETIPYRFEPGESIASPARRS
ncbi:MAG: LacI family DNA-binding transcriptional regulator [Solobacterium sp.]|nr:LacI family DNA-binding transcriptional regulator [Solobacterium sp.]